MEMALRREAGSTMIGGNLPYPQEQILKHYWFAVLGILLLVGTTSTALAGDLPPAQVIIEAGLSHPYGQLGASADNTRLGQGARDGLRLGFALRIPLTPTVSLAPQFAFVDYGNFDGSTPEVDEIRIESSSYRYGLELMIASQGPPRRIKPFLALAMGLNRNRLAGNYQDPTSTMDRSINSLGYTLRLGLQWSSLEFSGGYHINRFNTWQFYQSQYRERYNWDSLELRAGWRVPLGD